MIQLELSHRLNQAAKHQDQDVTLDYWYADKLEDAIGDLIQACKDLEESSITQADILEDGTTVPTKTTVDPEVFAKFQDILEKFK